MLNRGNLCIDDVKDPVGPIDSFITVVKDSEEKKPLFARNNTPDRILWKDWTIIKSALGFKSDEPVNFLKVIDYPNETKLKVHVLSVDQIPNRHLEYIATWYSLSALSFLMSFIRK